MPKPKDDNAIDAKQKMVDDNPTTGAETKPADDNAPVKGAATGEETKPEEKPKKEKLIPEEKPGLVKMVLMRYYGSLPPGALIWPTEEEAKKLEAEKIARRK